MRVDEQLMDITILGEGFELTQLWDMREALVELRDTLEGLKEKAINTYQIDDVVDLESRLFYVNRNIQMVESVMSLKELDIFDVTEYGELCWN